MTRRQSPRSVIRTGTCGRQRWSPTTCTEATNGLNEIDGSGKYSSGMLEYLLHIDGMLEEAPLYDRECQEEEDELADEDD